VQEVIKDIADKKNVDYCGAYELMKHDKLKQECFDSPVGRSSRTIGSHSSNPQLNMVTAADQAIDTCFFSINNSATWKCKGDRYLVSDYHI
jgi:hypothetical protein